MDVIFSSCLDISNHIQYQHANKLRHSDGMVYTALEVFKSRQTNEQIFHDDYLSRIIWVIHSCYRTWNLSVVLWGTGTVGRGGDFENDAHCIEMGIQWPLLMLSDRVPLNCAHRHFLCHYNDITAHNMCAGMCNGPNSVW